MNGLNGGDGLRKGTGAATSTEAGMEVGAFLSLLAFCFLGMTDNWVQE